MEVLARVDVVCVDKTGTLTEGSIAVDRHRACRTARRADDDVLGASARWRPPTTRRTPACGPIADRRRATRAGRAERPCRSRRPASGAAATFGGHGGWVLGAPERAPRRATPGSGRAGRATLADRRPPGGAAGPRRRGCSGEAPARRTSSRPRLVLPRGATSAPDAADTIAYFRDQGVAVKVISGDNPLTVGAVAAGSAPRGRRARRRPHAARRPRRARRRARGRTSVFGRVQPHQKRAMVARPPAPTATSSP